MARCIHKCVTGRRCRCSALVNQTCCAMHSGKRDRQTTTALSTTTPTTETHPTTTRLMYNSKVGLFAFCMSMMIAVALAYPLMPPVVVDSGFVYSIITSEYPANTWLNATIDAASVTRNCIEYLYN
jgi:hypothetical protein